MHGSFPSAGASAGGRGAIPGKVAVSHAQHLTHPMPVTSDPVPPAPTRDAIAASHAAAPMRDAQHPARPRVNPVRQKRGYGWLMIMLLIAAMFGTPVVIAAMILIRGT